MLTEKGIDFNDYPDFFRLGTFARRVKVYKPIDDALKRQLSAKGILFPTESTKRTEIQTESMNLRSLKSSKEFLFGSNKDSN